MASTMREHRQRVDGVAEHGEHAEGAEQHDRHGEGRDDRRADVLQEQEHHQEDQDDGLDQRLHHVLDRQEHERASCRRDSTTFDPLRKGRGQAARCVALTASAVLMALAPVARLMAMPAAGMPL